MNELRWAAQLVAAMCLPALTHAACTTDGPRGGILGLDRCDEFEATGIYSRRNQRLADFVVIAGTVGTALWNGTDSALGRSAWKSLDSIVTTAVAVEAMKNVFQRPRPAQSSNPNLWRQGHGNNSFPSGETALMAAFVTPIIVERRQETPAVWALAALPVYMGRARMSSQAHWLSDVVAGAAVGATAGYLSAGRDSPLLLAPISGGVFVGIRSRF